MNENQKDFLDFEDTKEFVEKIIIRKKYKPLWFS